MNDHSILQKSRQAAPVKILFMALLLISLGRTTTQAVTFTKGDVLVSVACGKVNWYQNDGTFVGTLDTLTGSTPGLPETSGSTFDSAGNFYVTVFQAGLVSKFDNSGTLLGTFGGGYNTHPESILIDAAGNFYVGQADGSRDILKFDSAGNPLASFNVATEARGSDWIDLAADQCTMFYTSEGAGIARFDVCSNTQLPYFVLPIPFDPDVPPPYGLPGSHAFALRLLPSGGLIVADSEAIYRLDAASNIIQTYGAGGERWFALSLDPDGTSFWSAGIFTGNVYKFDIASGAVLVTFNDTHCSSTGGLSVFGEIKVSNPCIVSCPPNTTVYNDPGQCAAVVNYTAPTISGSGCGTVTCTPSSGAVFPVGTTTVNCSEPGPFGAKCTFTVTVTIGHKCPLTQGYWKSHPGVWPVSSLTVGGITYNNAQLLAILNTSTTTDASLILARQLIPAMLNTANNGSDPTLMCSAVATAQSLLSGCNIPCKVKPSSALGTQMITVAGVLDKYNNGLMTRGCIPR
jgi:hypothetical protein